MSPTLWATFVRKYNELKNRPIWSHLWQDRARTSRWSLDKFCNFKKTKQKLFGQFGQL